MFNDANSTGALDTGEKPLAGRVVYIDKNKNGKLYTGEVSTTTAAGGSYSFKNLAAGSYRIKDMLPAGWRRTNPSVGYYDLTLTAGHSAVGKVFADTTTALVSGIVFKDANVNAKQDAGELGLAGSSISTPTRTASSMQAN